MADFEYLDNDEATWRYYPAPTLPNWVQEELTRIGGVNRFGKPNLRVVWGADAVSDRHFERSRLKYHCGWSPVKVPGYRYEKDGVTHFTTTLEDIDPSIMVFPEVKQEELGLPRWVIETWVSPEALEKMGRFRTRYADGDIDPTLREFPKEGVYDCFFIVENREGKFRQIDRDVIEVIRHQWWYAQKSAAEQEADRQKYLASEAAEQAARQEELQRAAVNLELRLPKEEKERREEYWRKQVNHKLQEEIAQRTGRWYVPELYGD